jgi:DNA polymerase-3 subunit alpha
VHFEGNLGNARLRKFTRQQYFKSSAEMAVLFNRPAGGALANAVSKRCNLKLELGSMLPNCRRRRTACA